VLGRWGSDRSVTHKLGQKTFGCATQRHSLNSAFRRARKNKSLPLPRWVSSGCPRSGCLYRREHTRRYPGNGALDGERSDYLCDGESHSRNQRNCERRCSCDSGRVTTNQINNVLASWSVSWCFRLSGSYDYDYYVYGSSYCDRCLGKPSDLNRNTSSLPSFGEQSCRCCRCCATSRPSRRHRSTAHRFYPFDRASVTKN